MNPENDTGSAPATDLPGRMRKAATEIGHDMNNCLGVVSGRAELVLMYLDKDRVDGARKGVEVILAQVERLRELSDALRDLDQRA